MKAAPNPFRQGASSGGNRRRAMIAKINIGRQQLGIEEDDYRAALLEVTGRSSLTMCDERQLDLMLDWLKSKGFRPVSSNGAADHPMARKARAMWISLYHLGEVTNPSEQALEAFAARQLGCERLSWANQRDAYKLIEALKAWAGRAGWIAGAKEGNQSPAMLQHTLALAIIDKLRGLGVITSDKSLTAIVRDKCPGIRPQPGQPYTVADWRLIVETLGAWLRQARIDQAAAGAARSLRDLGAK